MKPTFAAALLLVSGAAFSNAPAEIPAAFHGSWAETPARCDPNGPAADAIEVVKPREFHGYEYGCRVTRIKAVTATAVAGSAACGESGEKVAVQFSWQLLDGGRKVQREQGRPLVRCAAGASPAAATAQGVPVAAAAAPIAADQLATIGGALRVVDADPGRRLTLNGKPLPVEDDHVKIRQKFRVGGNDVVLVQTNCGGSACALSSLRFVTIGAGGKVTLSREMIANEEGDAQLRAEGDTLKVEIRIPERRGTRTQRWVYSAGQVQESR